MENKPPNIKSVSGQILHMSYLSYVVTHYLHQVLSGQFIWQWSKMHHSCIFLSEHITYRIHLLQVINCLETGGDCSFLLTLLCLWLQASDTVECIGYRLLLQEVKMPFSHPFRSTICVNTPSWSLKGSHKWNFNQLDGKLAVPYVLVNTCLTLEASSQLHHRIWRTCRPANVT